MNKDIIEKLLDGICSVNLAVKRDEIPLNEGLIKVSIIDSFGFVELLAFIENEFNISIEDDEITEGNFGTLNKMKNFIESKK